MNLIKNYIGPVFLIFGVPIILFATLININKVSNLVYPNTNSLIIFFILLTYGFLSIKLSNKEFTGNKNVDGVTPKYAANGFSFWSFTSILVIIISIFTKLPNIFVMNFIPFIFTCNIFGLIFVLYLYLKDKDNYYSKKEDDEKEMSQLYRFFRGINFHPKLLGVDIKQWTNCRFGMIGWQIIIILFAAYYFKENGFNNAIFTTVFLQSIYIAKFFYWETGYFNTLDITLDRAGYYICWGCLVFVPAMYTFTTYYLINNKPNISNNVAIIIVLLGLYFTYKNYEVDYQKELFKKNKENTIINGKPCKFLDVKYTRDNKVIDSKLLLSGHWGYSRHTNYTYEILTSACWSAVGYQYGVIPFTYLIYIIILLVHRIYRDEKKCKDKYGKYWDKYCQIVKYRLIKGIY